MAGPAATALRTSCASSAAWWTSRSADEAPRTPVRRSRATVSAGIVILATALLALLPRSASGECREHNFIEARTPMYRLDAGEQPLPNAFGQHGVCYVRHDAFDLNERQIAQVREGLKYKDLNLNYATVDSYPRDLTTYFHGGAPYDERLNNTASMNKILYENLEDILYNNAPIPCGFIGQPSMNFREPLSIFDHCGIVVTTHLVNNYDDMKPALPSVIDEVCYIAFVDDVTMAAVPRDPETPEDDLRTFMGWYLYRITSMPYGNPLKDNRVIKLLIPRLFPKARWSLHIDSSRLLRTDPAAVIYHLLVKQGADMAYPQHYMRLRTWDEVDKIIQIKGGRFDPESLYNQQRIYGTLGFPHNKLTGLVSSTVMLRDHAAVSSHLSSCAWFNEVVHYEPRDQVSFFPIMWWLGFRPCPTHEEFKQIKKNTPWRIHVEYDMWSDVLSSRMFAFQHCELSWISELHHHTRGKKLWRRESKFRCHLHRTCVNAPS